MGAGELGEVDEVDGCLAVFREVEDAFFERGFAVVEVERDGALFGFDEDGGGPC